MDFYTEILKYIRQDGYVECSASRELLDIREKLSVTEGKIKKAANEFYRDTKNLNYIAEDIISVRDGFSCVAIKSNYKNGVDGIVLDSSSSGQTVFIVPKKVIELHNSLVILKEKENEEIRRIFGFYTGRIVENSDLLFVIDYELIEFDVLYSKTCYCAENEYYSPKIDDKSYIKIIDRKHPFLGKTAVPLNIEIGSNFRIMVVTGPNTGGKTVVLKTIGIFILMVQCGMGIPANRDSTFVTTHYSALKHFASQNESIANASMEFDIKNLKPTFRLLVGIPGSSRALEISKRLGMPRNILDEDQQNISEDYLNSEKMISKLVEERKKLEEYDILLQEKEKNLKKKKSVLLKKDQALKKKSMF